MQTLILGLGNDLLADEGVGVHAVRRITQDKALPDVIAADVGTSILDALPLLEQAERIIVIDAMKAGGTPGTVYRIPLADCSGATVIASMHGFDIFRVMALSGRTDNPSVTVFGVEPELIDWSLELSPRVAESLPHLLKAVRDELKYSFALTGSPQTPPSLDILTGEDRSDEHGPAVISKKPAGIGHL